MVGLLAGSYFKNKKPQENQYLGVEFGGDEKIRTSDPGFAQMLP
jgi:hypothetical protein